MLGRVIGALREPALLVTQEACRVAQSNLAAEQLLGVNRTLRDQPLAAMVVGERQSQQLIEQLESCISSRGLGELEGLRLRCAAGNPLVVDGLVIPVADREPRGWVLLLRAASSTTDRALERALAQRMTTVAQLAADVSHKLHNLSTAVLAGLGQLRVELAASGTQSLAGLDALQEVVPQCNAVVDRFLGLCRGHPVVSGPFNVSEAVTDVVTLLEQTLPAAVTLECERGAWPTALFAHGDPELARQVVLGSALALRRALLEGGALRLDVRPPSPDAGAADGTPGRELASAGRSCCIALRAGPTAHPAGELAAELCAERELLSPFGGLLEVAADARQEALEVRLRFPVDSGTAERERLASGGHGERVVLVAPKGYVAQMMLSALCAAGYTAELACGPAALAAALRASRPALVILDDSAGSVAESASLLAEDQPTLLLVGAEPAVKRDASATMTVCRPFQLADIGTWVASMLAGEVSR